MFVEQRVDNTTQHWVAFEQITQFGVHSEITILQVKYVILISGPTHICFNSYYLPCCCENNFKIVCIEMDASILLFGFASKLEEDICIDCCREVEWKRILGKCRNQFESKLNSTYQQWNCCSHCPRPLYGKGYQLIRMYRAMSMLVLSAESRTRQLDHVWSPCKSTSFEIRLELYQPDQLSVIGPPDVKAFMIAIAQNLVIGICEI